MDQDPRLKSKWWRLTHLYKIRNKRGELVTFKPNRVQLMVLMAIGKRMRARFLKYRQGGITTLFCILYLDDALWTPGFSAAIIAHDRSTLDKIFYIVKRAYDNLPEALKPTTRQNTLRSYKFEKMYDGTKLDSEIYVDLKLRGGTVQALHVSERAYITGDKSVELEAGSKQAVPMFGRITEETTGNGFDDWHDAFMEDYENEDPGPLDYAALFFAWHEDPQYTLPGHIDQYTDEDTKLKETVQRAYDKELSDGQLLWYRWKKQELIKAARASEDKIRLSGDQLMKQEYPSTVSEAFQSGMGNVFEAELIEAVVPAEPIRTIKSESNAPEKYSIYKEPEPGKFYALGCDPSDGVADPAGIAIWDQDYVKVAEWHGLLRPDKLAKMVKEMAEKYNNAFAGVENNMLSTILYLSEIYDNFYTTVKIDEKRKKKTKKMGWTTTGKSRDVMIDDFIMHFEEGTLQNITKRTLKEMRTFVQKQSGKREHADGKHDDMLISDMIALQMIKNKDKSRTKKRAFAKKPGAL